MDKIVVLFTMKGCPHCSELKSMLIENELDFVERDIHEHHDEYEIFTQVTDSEYVPAFMIINNDEQNPSSKLFAPSRDFNTLQEGVDIIKKEII
mgnify:CR=1 FL=1